MKYITSLLFSFLLVQICIAQTEQVPNYPSLFQTADSLNKLGNSFSIDNAMLENLHELDSQAPANYLLESLHLFDENKFDEAAVLFHIGLIRHKYYISINPSYAPNEDWINAESMKAAYGKKFDFVLKTNIDKYILVLNLAADYCQQNDYVLAPKQGNIEKYNFQIDAIKKIINDYSNNKDVYTKQWDNERKILLSRLN